MSDFSFTGSEQTFVCPASGNYLLECWGAQGGTYSSYRGGFGGYSRGIVHLIQGETLYVNVGGQGASGRTVGTAPGGYNGGGDGTPYVGDNANYITGGGGCTHIAKVSGELKDLDPVSDLADILIVAGGGGGGYMHTNGPNYSASGGDGGGYIGGTNWNNNTSFVGGGGGTQSAGGAAGTSGAAGSFGQGGTSATYSSGGGGGFYGGGSANHRGTGAGSGYIGNDLLFTKRMVTFSNNTSPDPSTYTIKTTSYNASPLEDNAKAQDGYAKITLLARTTKYLLQDGNSDLWTVSGGTLTQVTGTFNAQLFADYGMDAIPDWSEYSSLTNPSVLCWDSDAEAGMTATTTGVPTPNAVISQEVPTGDGVQSVTIVSDNATLYSVSFDSGSTWWKYSGGAWSQVLSITDGMTKTEVEGIPSTAWASKNTGQVKFRFTLLDENGYVTSIRVDYTGGGGVGHTIVDPSGTSMTQRDGLQFVDAHLADDSVNDRTKVEVVKETTEVAFDALDETDVDNDGFYVYEDADRTILDASQVAYGSGTVADALTQETVSVTADGVKTYKMLFNELFALVDFSKITVRSMLTVAGGLFTLMGFTVNTQLIFILYDYNTSNNQSNGIKATLKASDSQYHVQNQGDYSNSVASNGRVITLYY